MPPFRRELAPIATQPVLCSVDAGVSSEPYGSKQPVRIRMQRP